MRISKTNNGVLDRYSTNLDVYDDPLLQQPLLLLNWPERLARDGELWELPIRSNSL